MKNFIRQVPIQVKILIMGSVPLLLLIYLSIQIMHEKRQKTELLNSFITRIQQSENISQLITSLQDERRYSFDYALQAKWQKELLTSRLRTDKYLKAVLALDEVSYKGLTEFTKLDQLLATRNKIDSNKLNANQVMQFYTGAVFRLNTLNPIPYLTTVYLKEVHHHLVAQKILSEIITYYGIIRSNIYNILHTRSYMIETLFGTLGSWEMLNSYEVEMKNKIPVLIRNDYDKIRNSDTSVRVFSYLDKLFSEFRIDSTYTADHWWTESESVSDQLVMLRTSYWEEASTIMNEQYRKQQQSNDRMLAFLLVIMIFVLGILIYSYLVINRDASTLKRIIVQRTADLREKNKELLRSNNELEQFAYVASHDLQEPLRKIQTFIDIIITSPPDKEATDKYLERINSSAKRMSDLINAVLNFSRIATADKHYEKVDLNIVASQVLTDLELVVSEKNARITIDKLPEIQAIPLQMNQLFSNLIMNALKFSNGTPEINITSRYLPAEEIKTQGALSKSVKYIELTFSDNGIGFNQEYADQIFTIFRRLHDRQVYQGTGIGLALCKKIIENHDGIITAEGSPGAGAKFRVVLPETRA